MNKNELIKLLAKYNIKFHKWGKGNTKSLDHLLKEINSGESVLIEENGELFRDVGVIVFNIFYEKDGEKYKLYEDRQEYKDGRVARRNLNDSLLEKLLPQEKPINGARRALSEELNITKILPVKDKGFKNERRDTLSFPTLISKGNLYCYEVTLPDSEYNPNGYTELQDDKTSYFKWKKI